MPTYSALRGMFDCVAFWKSAYIRPVRVEVCNPIQFQRYATNYGGPLRKGNQIAGGSSYQLFATILIDVCYKVHGVVVGILRFAGKQQPSARAPGAFRTPSEAGPILSNACLGWSEFVPTYFGPLRATTQAREDVEFSIPSMLRRVFDRDSAGQYGPTFDQDVRVEKGFFPLLNELSSLSHSLAARGIQTQAWHPWIQTYKKGEAIVAELNESGDLARVSLLSADQVAGLRNIAPDFHNSFPGLNLNCPVLVLPDEAVEPTR